MMTKRDFMKHAARTLLLGGLSALTYRQATSKKQSDICTDKNGYCRKCPFRGKQYAAGCLLA